MALSRIILTGLVVSSFCQSTSGNDFQWQTATPQSQGMCSEKLDAMRDDLANRDTKTFLVVRNDKIVYEWYAPDYGPTIPHYTASLAKAIVGGLANCPST